VDGRTLLGTAELHKTPLVSPVDAPEQLEQLTDWLTSFQPQELFDHHGHPAGVLAEALAHIRLDGLGQESGRGELKGSGAPTPVGSFSVAVTRAVRRHADQGDFRLFSPDELGSNRLGALSGQAWCHEVLAEEVLLAWLAGWTATGRRGLLIAYEGFASLFATGLISQLKQRRLMPQPPPSMNLLLTSLGWQNAYSHGDPSLATTLLGVADPAVHVLMPADPTRLSAMLDRVLSSRGRVNLMIAGKHTQSSHPTATIEEELTRGLAIWPHVSDSGDPDLTIVCCGDLAAEVTLQAAPRIREALGTCVRIVNVADLTVLGDPETWPAGLTTAERQHYFGQHAGMLVVTIGQPSAVRGLLPSPRPHPLIVGWREPSGPLTQHQLAAAAGIDIPGLIQAAKAAIKQRCEAR
jgi:xylulose-5-phosphate/fructose-6-phosphate phosphoketolase